MDIVEFVEKVFDCNLLDSQKEFVRKAYYAAKNDKRLYYIPPRSNSRFSFELLQAVVLIIVGQERGLLDKENATGLLEECRKPGPMLPELVYGKRKGKEKGERERRKRKENEL